LKTIKVGLAGCGFAGHIHSRALALIKNSQISSKVKIELVVAADTNEERANITAKQYGWKHAVKDWSDLFTYELDLVIVALPNNDHVGIVKQASKMKIAVLLEKPVARTYAEAIDLLGAVGNNKKIRVAYVNRFVPATQQAKLLIDKGSIGVVRNVRSVYLLNMRKTDGFADWRFDIDKAGYGASDDLGTHHIDLINFLASDITEVQSRTRIWDIDNAPAATNDDAINSLLTLRNKGFGTLSASRTSPGHPLTGYIEIEGSKGAIRIDRAYLNDLFIRNESGVFSQKNVRPVGNLATLWASPTIQGAHPFSWYDCFAFQMAEMVQLAAGIPLSSEWSATLVDGIKAMAVTEAMIMSTSTLQSEKVTFPSFRNV
jgi:predicted dehydrogenase